MWPFHEWNESIWKMVSSSRLPLHCRLISLPECASMHGIHVIDQFKKIKIKKEENVQWPVHRIVAAWAWIVSCNLFTPKGCNFPPKTAPVVQILIHCIFFPLLSISVLRIMTSAMLGGREYCLVFSVTLLDATLIVYWLVTCKLHPEHGTSLLAYSSSGDRFSIICHRYTLCSTAKTLRCLLLLYFPGRWLHNLFFLCEFSLWIEVGEKCGSVQWLWGFDWQVCLPCTFFTSGKYSTSWVMQDIFFFICKTDATLFLCVCPSSPTVATWYKTGS